MRPPGASKPRSYQFTRKLGKKLFRGVLFDYIAKQSLVPTTPVLDAGHFPWADEFRARWPKMRAELEQQLENRSSIPRFQDISPDQYKISPDDQWRTFVFYGFGHRSELACELCPETAAALAMVPKLESAFFSILAPGKHVPRHRGVTKGMVRCHLGLKVPEDGDHCFMNLQDSDGTTVRCEWKEGEVLFFDDTFKHEVWNDTDEERVVLLFDFERPMSWAGQMTSRTMMLALRQTAYFKDALRNHQEWERRYREQHLQGSATPPA